MKRTRLTLGDRQVERLLLAIAYAIDTFSSDDEDPQHSAFERQTIREWKEVRETIRRAMRRAAAR